MGTTARRFWASAACALAALAAGCGEQSAAPQQAATSGLSAYGALPLAFEANAGRTDGRVRYLVRGSSGTAFFTGRGADLTVRRGSASALLGLRLVGARDRELAVRGERRQPGVIDELVGPRKAWKTGIASFGRVRYPKVYPGVDLVFHGDRRKLEYDFEVRPGADPRQIGVRFTGAQPRLRPDGSLALRTRVGTVVQHAPRVYQRVDGRQRTVAGRYERRGDATVGFRLGRYDRSLPLVIDPVIEYSTYLGGSGEETGTAIAADATGAVYVTGRTASTDYPRTTAIGDPGSNGDVLVSKLSPDGDTLEYSATIGGAGDDAGQAIAVNRDGTVAVAGRTASGDFPRTARTGDYFGATDAFHLRLAPTETGYDYAHFQYLGSAEDDAANAIVLGEDGVVTIGGSTMATGSGFPTTAHAMRNDGGGREGFVATYDAAGETLTAATLLGGELSDEVDALVRVPAADGGTRLVAGGRTTSPDFPDDRPAGGRSPDAWVAQVSPDASALTWATRLGGTGSDVVNGLAFDRGGEVFAVGDTTSSGLGTEGAADREYGGSGDGFVARLDDTGGLRVFSYVGGAGADGVAAVAIDPLARVWLAGRTGTPADAALWRFSAHADAQEQLVTLPGNDDDIGLGVATDAEGNGYMTGRTASANFPATAALQPALSGGSDAFVVRVDGKPPETTLEPARVDGLRASLTFGASEPTSELRCRIDDGDPFPCSSPHTTGDLTPGEHTFFVAAIDVGRNTDPTEASTTFTVTAPTTTTTGTTPTTTPTTTAPTPTTTAQAPAPAAPAPPNPPTQDPVLPPSDGRVDGPGVVRFGQPASYTATFAGTVSSYAWDVDGSGEFAVSTGGDPVLNASMAKVGPGQVRVRAVGPKGVAEAAKAVRVIRPPVAQLVYRPAQPEPGEGITFEVAYEGESQFKPAYYAWKLEGLKPETRTLKRRGAARSRGARAAANAAAGTVTLSDAQPTATGKLERSFPKAGVKRVEVTVVGGDGTERRVHADIPVGKVDGTDVLFGDKPGFGELLGDGRSRGLDPKGAIRECTIKTVCGAIEAPTRGTTGYPVTFGNAASGTEFCWEGLGVASTLAADRIGVTAMTKKKDLGYPPEASFNDLSDDTGFKVGNEVSGKVGNVAAAKGARAAAGKTKTVKKTYCVTFQSQTVSWNFGDGTAAAGVEPDQPSYASEIHHSYSRAGTYDVSVVTRHFTLDASKLPDPKDAKYYGAMADLFGGGDVDTDALVKAGVLKPYLIRTGLKFPVVDGVCGKAILVKGVEVRARAIEYGSARPYGPALSSQCLQVLDNPDVYEPMPGQALSVNGLIVIPEGAADGTGGGAIVDRKSGVVSTRDGRKMVLQFAAPPDQYGTVAKYPAGTTTSFTIGKPTRAGSLAPGRATFALPDFGGMKDFDLPGGFKASGGRVLLSSDRTATMYATVQEREPISGGTPPLFIGGAARPPVATISKTGDYKAEKFPPEQGSQPKESNFSLDLSGTNLGSFKVIDFRLAHFPEDGWYGAGAFEFPVGKETYTIDAPYRAPPPPDKTSIKCAEFGEKGPAGLRISDNTNVGLKGFEFAGARIRGFSLPIGPVEVNCFAASFQAKPFTILGYASGRFPPSTGEDGKAAKELAKVDACIMVAILDKGEKTAGCAIKDSEFGQLIEGKGIGASQDMFWLAVRGEIDFAKGAFKVNGGLDLRAGADLLKIGAQIGITERYYGPWRIGGSAFGNFNILPEFGFELGADVQIAYLGCPACATIKALVSSKGVGACVDVVLVSGGFAYPWGGKVKFFAGCDWDEFKAIRLGRASLNDRFRVGAEPTAFSAASTRDVTLTKGDVSGPATALVFEGDASGAPIIDLAGPGGVQVSVPATDGQALFKRDGTPTTAKGFDPANDLRVQRVSALPQDALAPTKLPFDPVGPEQFTEGRSTTPEVAVPVTPMTIVTVPKAKAGVWKATVRDGSPLIKGTAVQRKLVTRQVLANVVGKGQDRRLNYVVRPVPGQTVRFVEDGAAVSRPIGRPVKGGRGTLEFPKGYGLKGARRIYAVIEQDGLPVQRVLVDRYRAEGPPKVPAPVGVTAVRERGTTLRTCWKPVDDATSYEVRVKGTNGTDLPATTRARCIELPGFDQTTGADVTVVAVTPYGRSRASKRDSITRTVPAPRLVR